MNRVILRLPLLTLRGGETKRLPAREISKIFGMSLLNILPVDLSLDEAWEHNNQGFTFVVYFESTLQSARNPKPNYKFRLVEKQHGNKNWENLLDEGTAEEDIKWDTSSRADSRGVIEVKSKALGRYKLIVPLDNFCNAPF